MAFSMSQVKLRNKLSNNVNVVECFSVVKNLGILTDGVKYGLTIYLRKRIKTKGVTNLTSDNFYAMIQRLLAYCCDKPFMKISYTDVECYEHEILYQIKMAIKRGFMRELYATPDEIYKYEKINDEKPVKLDKSVELNQTLVEKYFGDVIVI